MKRTVEKNLNDKSFQRKIKILMTALETGIVIKWVGEL